MKLLKRFVPLIMIGLMVFNYSFDSVNAAYKNITGYKMSDGTGYIKQTGQTNSTISLKWEMWDVEGYELKDYTLKYYYVNGGSYKKAKSIKGITKNKYTIKNLKASSAVNVKLYANYVKVDSTNDEASTGNSGDAVAAGVSGESSSANEQGVLAGASTDTEAVASSEGQKGISSLDAQTGASTEGQTGASSSDAQTTSSSDAKSGTSSDAQATSSSDAASSTEKKTVSASLPYTRFTTSTTKVTGVKQARWWSIDNIVDVTWNAQSDCMYECQFYNPNGSKYGGLETVSKNSISVKYKQKNKSGYVRVRSFVKVNGKKVCGPWSQKIALIAQPTIDEGSASDTGVFTNWKGASLTINWNKVDKANKYMVYVSTKEYKGYKKVATVGKNVNSVTISKLGKNKISSSGTYYVYIIATRKYKGKTYSSGRIYSFKVQNAECTICWSFIKDSVN